FGTLLAVFQATPVWREYGPPKNRLQAAWRALRPAKAVFASGVSGAVGGLVAYFVLRGAAKIPAPTAYETEIFLVVCVPLVLVVFSVVAILLVGLTSKFTLDEDREWWARSGAFILLAVGGWLIVTGLVLFGARGLAFVSTKIQAAIAAAGGLTAFVVSKIGASPRCSSGRDNRATPGLRMILGTPDRWLPTLGLLGLAMVAVVVCSTNERLIESLAPDSGVERLGAFLIALFGEAAFVLLISWYVNVNKFSLHAMYRNRLVRAYL